MKEFIIRIGKDTNPIKAAKSICGQLLEGSDVKVDAIGMLANYTAIKAFIQVQKDLTMHKMLIAFIPSFLDLETDNGLKTTVRWEVKIIN